MTMIKLLEYTFDNTIDSNCLPTFAGVGATEVVDSVSGNITTRIINVEETGLPTNISFFNKTALLTLTYVNGDNVTSTLNMFNDCTNLTSVNLSNFNTSKVVTMQQMFSGCINLVELKGLDRLDTSNVTSMLSVFGGCRKIEKLDLINFNTSKVTNMRMTFANCNALKELNIGTWDISKVTEMSSMFENCSSLNSLDLSHFRTKNVKNIANIFLGCSSLQHLNLSGIGLDSSTSTQNLFSNCKALTTLDISNFNMSNITNDLKMFSNCNSLSNIGLLYSDSATINKIAPLLPTTASKNIYYLDVNPSELTPVNNVEFVKYKTNILMVNEDVTLRSNGDVCDELDLLTGQLTQRIDENNEVLVQEVIKTVALTIKDQNDVEVSQLSSFNGGTRFSTTSQDGSLLPSLIVDVVTNLEETLKVCSLEGNTM